MVHFSETKSGRERGLYDRRTVFVLVLAVAAHTNLFQDYQQAVLCNEMITAQAGGLSDTLHGETESSCNGVSSLLVLLRTISLIVASSSSVLNFPFAWRKSEARPKILCPFRLGVNMFRDKRR